MATPAFGYQNNYEATLSGNIGASDTTIALSVAPSPSEGVLVIEPDSATNWEVIYYTSKSGSSVVLPSEAAGRGQGGSTAIAHSSGVTVKMIPVDLMWEVLQDGSALADESMTTRKLAPTTIIETCTADVITSGTTIADITGCTTTFTPAIACAALVIGTFDFSGNTGADLFKGILDVDGTDQDQLALYQNANTTNRMTVSQMWLISLTAAAHTLKLQTGRLSGTGTVTARQTHTRLMVLLFGDANATIS